MKRLLALLLGGLGLRALLARRRRPAVEASPADSLRAKLDEVRTEEPEPPAADRRAGVHERARQAIDELRDQPE
ncbi:MAG TPA: hypothetical protein VFA82_04575 [Gaiellaceae bacterium]|nr:hypothetical protein [Gaiellaceae bacterium]